MQVKNLKQHGMLMLLLCVGLVHAKEPIPTKITDLITPESVVQDKDGSIYISEIGEFGQAGDGQISVVDKKGKVKIFAKGMDDPKGLVIMNDMFYVTDNKKVLQIDKSGQVSVYVDEKSFPKSPLFLNDIETDHFGNLYVTDSGTLKSGGAIYKIDKDKNVSTVVDSTNPKVLAPNGLFYEGRNNLLTVDFESGILYRINLMSGEMTELASGFGGGDGIVKTKTGKIFVSDWKNGIINQVSAKKARLISAGLTSSADIALSQNGHYILVPLMKVGELQFIEIK